MRSEPPCTHYSALFPLSWNSFLQKFSNLPPPSSAFSNPLAIPQTLSESFFSPSFWYFLAPHSCMLSFLLQELSTWYRPHNDPFLTSRIWNNQKMVKVISYWVIVLCWIPALPPTSCVACARHLSFKESVSFPAKWESNEVTHREGGQESSRGYVYKSHNQCQLSLLWLTENFMEAGKQF